MIIAPRGRSPRTIALASSALAIGVLLYAGPAAAGCHLSGTVTTCDTDAPNPETNGASGSDVRILTGASVTVSDPYAGASPRRDVVTITDNGSLSVAANSQVFSAFGPVPGVVTTGVNANVEIAGTVAGGITLGQGSLLTINAGGTLGTTDNSPTSLQGGFAIAATGNGTQIIVGGTVSASGAYGSAIVAGSNGTFGPHYVTSNINVLSGGLVSATGNGGNGIVASGGSQVTVAGTLQAFGGGSAILGNGTGAGTFVIAIAPGGLVQSSGQPAILTQGENVDLTIAGTISGPDPSLTVISFGSGTNRVTLDSGALVYGTISGGSGVDTARLVGTGTTFNAAQTIARFANFEALTVDSGYWTATKNVGAFATASIAAGASLEVRDVNATGTLTVPTIIDDGTLILNFQTSAAATAFFANDITGSGGVVLSGPAVVTTTKPTLYTGLTTLANGQLVLGGTLAGPLLIGDGTTLAAGASGLVLTNAVSTAGAGTINGGAGVFTLNGAIGGPGSITSVGTGTLVLNGNNSFSNLSIAAGTVTLGTSTSAGAGAISLADGATLAAGVSGLVLTNAVLTAGTGTINGGAGVFTLNGAIVGPGSLTTTGTGNLVLNAGNSFTNLSIAAGTVTLGTSTSAGTGSISLADGVTLAAGGPGLVLANAITTAGAATINGGTGMFTINGAIAGPGSITTTGSGNLVLNGNNSFTNLGIVAGSVTLGTASSAGKGGISLADGTTLAAGVSGLVVTNAIATTGAGAIATGSYDLTLAGGITGFGGLVKTGTGGLTLSGIDSYTGATTVSGGRLTVNGSLTNSAVRLASGTTLAGTGSVASVTASSNSTIAPGATVGSIGTLAVTGNAVVQAGSTFAVDVSPTAADRLTVVGTASLAGALVVSGSYAPRTSFTLLSAAGGLTGSFTSTIGSANGAFLPIVTYTAQNVLLSFTPKSLITQVGSAAITPNQLRFATAFDAATATTLDPSGFAALFVTGLAVPAALDQLTGEIHSVERRVAMDDTRYVREAAFDRLGEGASLVGRRQETSTTSGASGHTYTLWARGVGSWGSSDSDGNGSSFNTSSAGVISGVELAFEGGKIGAFGSYISTDIGHYALGHGTVETTGGGIYAGYRRDRGFAVAAGGALTGVRASSSRTITVPGLEQSLTARSDGNTYQAFVEAAYDLAGTARTRVEPFLRFAWVKLDTAAFNEIGGVAALGGQRAAYTTEVTTGGLRGALTMPSFGGFALKGSIGGQHTGGDRAPVALLALAGTGSYAAVTAVPVDRWMLAADVGAEFRVGSSATFYIGYNGVNGKRTRDNGVQGTLTVGF